jgi:hypothetical protein
VAVQSLRDLAVAVQSGPRTFTSNETLSRLSLVNPNTIQVSAQVHHREYGTAKLNFPISMSCAPSQPTADDPNPTGNSISLSVGGVDVTDVDGDALVDILDFPGIADSVAEDEINGQLDSTRESLNDIVRGLQFCPPLSFVSPDGGPPALSTGVPAGIISLCQ